MERTFELVKRPAFSQLLFDNPKTRKYLHDLQEIGVSGRYGSFSGYVVNEAKEHLLNLIKKGGEIYFLDAGAGTGSGLVEVEKLSPNVRAYGLALNAPKNGLVIPADRWIQDHFEKTVFKLPGSSEGPFHIIQSNLGIHHAANKAIALENMLNSLRVGGKLFDSHGFPHRYFSLPGLAKTLRKQGFIIEQPRTPGFVEKILGSIRYRDKGLCIITRKTTQNANLREFYESEEINWVPLKKTTP